MAAIPGIRFDITGASGSQGLLTPKSGWRTYTLPRGGYVSQDSASTTLTFDSSAIAGRFAAGIWIQAGLSAANIRQVAAVGGNSITVSGAALTVSENDRIYIIGSTEPTISGGSVTYSTPATTIRQRDDDGSDRYTNSMCTSTSNGLIQFFSEPAVYDILVQDGNQALQGSLIDVPVGVAEGISTSYASVFGATVTFNTNVGITGTLTVSGWATFGSSVTVAGAIGVTGTATVGATITGHANAGFTGTMTIGATTTIGGGLTLGAPGIVGGLSVTTGIFGVSNQPRVWLVNSANQDVTSGTAARLTWDTEHFDVGGLHSGSSSTIVVVNPGFYLLIGQVEWAAIVGATGTTAAYTATIRKNNTTYEVAEVQDIAGTTSHVLKQSLSGMDLAVAGDYYDLAVVQQSGTTQTVTCTTGRLNTQFQAVKLF